MVWGNKNHFWLSRLQFLKLFCSYSVKTEIVYTLFDISNLAPLPPLKATFSRNVWMGLTDN